MYNTWIPTAPAMEPESRISKNTYITIIVFLILIILGFIVYQFTFANRETDELRSKVLEYSDLIDLNSHKAFTYDEQVSRNKMAEENNRKLLIELGKHINSEDNLQKEIVRKNLELDQEKIKHINSKVDLKKEIVRKNLELDQERLKTEMCKNATSNVDYNHNINQILIIAPAALTLFFHYISF